MLQNTVSYLQHHFLFIPVLLIMVSILVAAHEYGHYLFARLFGMGVEEFAIGFGRKPIWTYARKKYLIPVEEGQILESHLQSIGMHCETSSLTRKVVNPVVVDTPTGKAVEETTDFTVRAWPLGGFVRIKGMMPEEDGSEINVPGGFYSKAPWKRFIVLLAGPVFSVIAGVILLFCLAVTAGETKANPQPVIGEVSKDLPAAAAGLKAGDRILSLDGKPVHGFYDIVVKVRSSAGKSLPLTYSRNGQTYSTSIIPIIKDKAPTPVWTPEMTLSDKKAVQAIAGIKPTQTHVPVSIGDAAVNSIMAPYKLVVALVEVFSKPSGLKNAVGGPISIAQATQEAVDEGFAYVVFLAAMLSISVGIFNLFPIAPLDGGQMAIAFLEMLRRGRRLSMRVQGMIAATGIALIATLFAVVMFIDFQRLGKPLPNGPAASTPPAAAHPAKP